MATLKDLFPNWFMGDGLLTRMNSIYNLPWFSEEYDATSSDIDYLGTFGNRLISPLAWQVINTYSSNVIDNNSIILVDDNGRRIKLTATALEMLAKLCYNRFNKQWTKLYATLNFEYNPIENYNMVEEESSNDNNTQARNETNSNSEKHSNTTTGNTSTQAVTDNTSNTNQDNSLYAFNSSSAQPTAEQVNTATNKEVLNNKQNSTANEDIDITRTNENTLNDTTNHTNSRKLTRSGNIGVTTSQQMLEQERKIAIYDFLLNIYNDINQLLTIPYYDLDNI